VFFVDDENKNCLWQKQINFCHIDDDDDDENSRIFVKDDKDGDENWQPLVEIDLL